MQKNIEKLSAMNLVGLAQRTSNALDMIEMNTDSIRIFSAKNLTTLKIAPSELGGKRAYVGGFEIYKPQGQDPDHRVVEIYLGIRS